LRSLRSVSPLRPPNDLKNAGAFEINGDYREAYQRFGGALGMLGAPIGDPTNTTFGVGKVQRFEHGAIYWSTATRAHVLGEALDAKLVALATQKDAYGTSVQRIVGFPVTDQATMGDRVVWARFQGGEIYAPNASGTYVVYGAILAKYRLLGGASGTLGTPMSDELASLDGGRVSRFQGGDICWTASAGVQVIRGAIDNRLARRRRRKKLAGCGHLQRV